jgi:phosphatidyl-myo-inositol dimannoside synthase
MRTLLFTLEYPPFKGGVATYYGNIEKYWPKFASASLGLGPDDPESRLRVLHNNDGALFSKWLWPRWLPAVGLFKRAVERQGIQHVIVGQILPLGTIAYRYYKKTGLPYTVILHGMDLALAMKPGRKQLIAKAILANARHIICGNAYTANLAIDYAGEAVKDKIQVVHPGVDSDFYADKAVMDDIRKKHNLINKTVLLSYGRLVKRKGFENVIKAMPEIIKQNPDVHYFISGDGPEKMRILDLSMKYKNITLLDRLSDKEKNAWLALCDIFIMPSYSEGPDFEGFGIVFLEANIAGKPVIGGRSGGVPEAIDDGVSGILVEPRDTVEIAKAVLRLANDPGLRQKIGRQGYARALEWFNWERQIGRFYKIINS